MSETEVGEWVKLFQVGGNAGIIVLTIIAVKVANAFLAKLDKVAQEQVATRTEIRGDLEDIKRAMVANNPAVAPMFDRRAG